MNEQIDKKRIEELISRTINTQKPRFDAEKWKQKYSEEYKALLLRTAKGNANLQPAILKVILKSPPVQIAAAAVIIIAVSFLITHRLPDKQKLSKISEAKKSPTEMMTAISLERAFRSGGIEAVEEQCKQAFRQIAPQRESSSIKQILAEFNGNGKSSERTRP